MTSDTSVPRAAELMTGARVKQLVTINGTFRNHDDRASTHLHFFHRVPDRWAWFQVADPTTGAITDGHTQVVVLNGVAVIAGESGRVRATHRLTNLLDPRQFDFSTYELSDVSRGEAAGRPAWLVSATPSKPEKEDLEVAFDQESGVMLSMRSASDYFLGFDELFLDHEFPGDIFEWEGPHEPRRVGVARVTPQEGGTYSVMRDVSVGREGIYFCENGPDRVPRDVAIAWGEAHAEETIVREE